ncbi:hypothetical protein Taro_050037 [Colocasia esculenta]|uniref:Uncharacterized protein n=1 Tax=Colocasia esculenta TaxID=4460 RepID=A0A843XCF1_COLES|nr:hypothetical protein [Colocasia esculenta]
MTCYIFIVLNRDMVRGGRSGRGSTSSGSTSPTMPIIPVTGPASPTTPVVLEIVYFIFTIEVESHHNPTTEEVAQPAGRQPC